MEIKQEDSENFDDNDLAAWTLEEGWTCDEAEIELVLLQKLKAAIKA